MSHHGPELKLYVGTYTDKEVKSDGIYIFNLKFDANYTNFTYSTVGSTKVLNPSFLTITNNKKYLLAVTEMKDADHSKVHSYKILQDGKLEYINSAPAQGTYTCYVSVSPDDKFAYVANYFGGVAASFGIDDNGSLSSKNSISFTGSSKVHQQRQEAPHIHMMRASPDGRYVYLTDLGNDHIIKFPFDQLKGFQSEFKSEFKSPAGAGPRHLDFHPSGNYLYLSCELSNTVSVYRIKSKETGDLELIQTISSLQPDVQDSMIAEIRADPTGHFLYVSNRGPDTITAFAIQEGGSKLILKDFYSTQGKVPRNFDLNQHVLIAANQDSDTLTVFRRENGTLIPIGHPLPCPRPVRVKIF